MRWGSEGCEYSMMSNPAENKGVKSFLEDHKFDMPDLFRIYDYDGDYYVDGFPKLFDLEQNITGAAKQNLFDRESLMMIANWGDLRDKKLVEKITHAFKIPLYINGQPENWLKSEPEKIIRIVGQIPGFGPTFSSKLLHFAVPQVFGIIDTWLVRTFGEGDSVHQQYKFLDLNVTNPSGGWRIPETKVIWPTEFGKWIRILNYIADRLNEEKILCPHPSNFLEAGLRKDGIWYPADVETALFSYAYEGRGVNIIRALGHDNKPPGSMQTNPNPFLKKM